MTTATFTLDVPEVGAVELTVDERGAGQPFLLLHGGGGPNTVAGFAGQFAATRPARVITPTHPGFGGTTRPDGLSTIAGLAKLYSALLDRLGVEDVTVIGSSIGGWIAAELALLASLRVSGIVLVDSVGLEVPSHPVADFFSLTIEEVVERSFHDPGRFAIVPESLPPAAQEVMASDRLALAAYAGTSMTDPTLAGRLATLEMPALVLWGDSDRIVDPDYGRAYAAAIPVARFRLLTGTGHMPQMETPDELLDAIWDAREPVFPADLVHGGALMTKSLRP
jgi:pimeloyl-ACP methyl ester carboxylesterase